MTELKHGFTRRTALSKIDNQPNKALEATPLRCVPHLDRSTREENRDWRIALAFCHIFFISDVAELLKEAFEA